MISTLLGTKLPVQQWTAPPELTLENWCDWCACFEFDKFLVGVAQARQLDVLMAFASRVRSGAFGHGKHVGCQAVATALRHVAQAFVLASHTGPRKGLVGPKLGLAFTRLHHSYRNEDPAPQPQLALPISVFQNTVEHKGKSFDPKQRGMADLVVIAFFFLLQAGERALPSGNRQTN